MLQIVIPMAGAGSRFAQAGARIPKPMLEVEGRPMFVHAVESLPLELASTLVFVCRAEHLESHGLREAIERYFGRRAPIVVEIEHVTEGQACTVLEAALALDPDLPLLIHNADTAFRSELARLSLESGADGILTLFEAASECWSFARVDDSGLVVEVAEKRPISRWASVGAYWFRRAEDFLTHAHAMIRDEERSGAEFYVGPVYNRLIAEGRRVLPDYAHTVRCMGTPAQLAALGAGAQGAPP